MIRVSPAGPGDAEVVHALTQAAFAEHGALDPPSGALKETVTLVAEQLAARAGAVAYLDDVAVGALRLTENDGMLAVRRMAVDPAYRGRGVARALLVWAEDVARREGRGELRLGVRKALADNRAMYEHLGYTIVADHGYYLELRKEL